MFCTRLEYVLIFGWKLFMLLCCVENLLYGTNLELFRIGSCWNSFVLPNTSTDFIVEIYPNANIKNCEHRETYDIHAPQTIVSWRYGCFWNFMTIYRKCVSQVDKLRCFSTGNFWIKLFLALLKRLLKFQKQNSVWIFYYTICNTFFQAIHILSIFQKKYQYVKSLRTTYLNERKCSTNFNLTFIDH